MNYIYLQSISIKALVYLMKNQKLIFILKNS